MLRELDTAQLSVGMYVSDLDRPWLETPFPVQGFYVRSREDVDRLSSYCRRVFVDPRRYDARLADACAPQTASDPDTAGQQKVELPPRSVEYQDEASVEDELPAARQALSESARGLEAFWSRLSERRRIHIDEVRAAVDPLVDSILRNRDALVALMRVQRADRHTHEHCLAMAVWASLVGRQLGLPPETVKTLAMGCSLVDVGLARLPQSVLDDAVRRTPASEAVYRAHVDFSLEILESMGARDDAFYEMVRWHHERMDGSGFPDGLAGPRIPMLARIAGIVDVYDSLISPRQEAAARSSFEALLELQEDSPELFQKELIEQFSQAVGIFPSGSLVELNTGEVAVVFSQNTGRRLRPKVVLILGPDQRQRTSFPVVDLSGPNERHLKISRELAPGEYGIDAREYFL